MTKIVIEIEIHENSKAAKEWKYKSDFIEKEVSDALAEVNKNFRLKGVCKQTDMIKELPSGTKVSYAMAKIGKNGTTTNSTGDSQQTGSEVQG